MHTLILCASEGNTGVCVCADEQACMQSNPCVVRQQPRRARQPFMLPRRRRQAFCVSPRQTAMGLAVAEAACGFEHRDLHWGNVLLSREPLAPRKTCRLRCGASRLCCGEAVSKLRRCLLSGVTAQRDLVMLASVQLDVTLTRSLSWYWGVHAWIRD